MEIISYISTSDWYVHYVLNNALWIPFEFWIILVWGVISLIYLVLKKLVW